MLPRFEPRTTGSVPYQKLSILSNYQNKNALAKNAVIIKNVGLMTRLLWIIRLNFEQEDKFLSWEIGKKVECFPHKQNHH